MEKQILKKGVYTSYRVKEKKFSSYILCNSLNNARLLADARGLDETIDSKIQFVNTIPDFTLLPDSEFRERMPEILHTAAFLSFVGLKSKSISLADVLGDYGAFHEILHIYSGVYGGSTRQGTTKMKKLLKVLQESAVGLF